MRLVYFGTPEAAVPPLLALVEAGHDVVLVVTNPDRRRGRGAAASPSPVSAAAGAAGLPVSHDPADALGVSADLGVVVAYGHLLAPELLDALPLVNLHFSLLPRWRGAAPVERAILAGDEETGVCLMGVEPTLDTGPVHRSVRITIGPDRTADELRAELSRLGARLLVDALDEGLGEPTPQSADGVTHAAKLDASDRHLDWEMDATSLHRVVRVGRAWTTFRGRRLVVHRSAVVPPVSPGVAPGALGVRDGRPVVGCGDGTALELLEVQPEGRSRQSGAEFVRGRRPDDGDRLGD